jgi:hypothetical protein
MNRPSAVMRGRHRRRDRRRTTSLAFGRTTTVALVLWSGYLATWAAVSDSDAAIVAMWWLAGVCLVEAIAHASARRDTSRP